MTAGSSGISAAGSAHPVIISRRRRPADSRPAACRIILIRDRGADGPVGERRRFAIIGRSHPLLTRAIELNRQRVAVDRGDVAVAEI
jgi:hypothetical protein